MTDAMPAAPGIMIIKRSVGHGGANDRHDVATVQVLLNRTRVRLGIPVKSLAVDGIVGPKTLSAIREFQKTITGESKKIDGRVDPGQATIIKLNIVAGNLPPLNNGIAYQQTKNGLPPAT